MSVPTPEYLKGFEAAIAKVQAVLEAKASGYESGASHCRSQGRYQDAEHAASQRNTVLKLMNDIRQIAP